jgi:D-aspartate ligase
MRNDLERVLPTLGKKEIPVLLLGGINLARALGEARIPAIVAFTDPEDPALDSRYCAASLALPGLDTPAALEALLVTGQRLCAHYGRRVPLMFGSDDALELVGRHRARLERYFLFLVNDAPVAVALIAKDRFQAFGRERGLPVPRALAFNGRGADDLAAFPGAVLAKPKVKYDWHNTELCTSLFGGDGKALIFSSGAEAASHPEVAANASALLFQEYVAGSDEELWSFHGYADAEGAVLAGFVGRKVRTFPALTGESAFVELAFNRDLETLGRDVARRCPLKGFFKMDFKRDARTGGWHLLEINARCSLWNYVGARNGVNLMAVAYRYLLDGGRPGSIAYGIGWRWINLRLDWRAYRELAGRGELSFARWAWSVIASRNVYSLFAWTDPAPFLRFWQRRILRKLAPRARRFTTRLLPWRSTAS